VLRVACVEPPSLPHHSAWSFCAASSGSETNRSLRISLTEGERDLHPARCSTLRRFCCSGSVILNFAIATLLAVSLSRAVTIPRKKIDSTQRCFASPKRYRFEKLLAVTR